jgi:hypothetical protein
MDFLTGNKTIFNSKIQLVSTVIISQVPMTEEQLLLDSKGKSRRARQIQKQQKHLRLCRNAHTTTMQNYLAVLMVLMEDIHAQKRL